MSYSSIIPASSNEGCPLDFLSKYPPGLQGKLDAQEFKKRISGLNESLSTIPRIHFRRSMTVYFVILSVTWTSFIVENYQTPELLSVHLFSITAFTTVICIAGIAFLRRRREYYIGISSARIYNVLVSYNIQDQTQGIVWTLNSRQSTNYDVIKESPHLKELNWWVTVTVTPAIHPITPSHSSNLNNCPNCLPTYESLY